MSMRYTYAGLGGLLLTLACGSKIEIGQGLGGGAGTGASLPGGANAGGSGAEDAGGESSGGTSGSQSGSSTGGTGAVSSAGTTHVGGPIPVDDGPQKEAGKVDLLLAIDNSLSMPSKQKLFAEALPELIERLVNPRCVDSQGNVVSKPASPSAACPSGSQRELKPVRDLHIGAITSSLGSHGASVSDVCGRPGDDDHAYLLPLIREGVPSYDDRGYLKWDPDGLAQPPGESDSQALAEAVRVMVESAGENGCGYEAQLESVYRFLVDPEPYESVERAPDSSLASKVGVDEEVLRQRSGFLRPDSSVVVLMLTDENDCSIVDEGYGWLIARAPSPGKVANMYRSTSQCLSDPNDPCCQSCGEGVENAGCPPLANDSECLEGKTLADEDDSLNLRCWEQKRRFGFDLLYPTARYVSGFGGGKVPARDGTLVANPLFRRGGTTRDPSLFTFAVLGGMPWQDVATTASLSTDTLQLLTAAQLETQGRWPLLIGDVASNVPPQDPFMRESVDERSGKNPLTNERVVAASSQDPDANSINGHEHETFGWDLQYACTFDLPEPIVCDESALQAGVGCDCFEDELAGNRAICNPPGGGAPTTTQYRGKAYPALRELRVARELGRRTVVSSVCSRNTADEERDDYGYRPNFEAIGQRVADTLEKP
jgi:hypothetical protein